MKPHLLLAPFCLLTLGCATSSYTPSSPPADPAEYYQASGHKTVLPNRRLLPDPINGLGQTNDPNIRVTDIRLTSSYTVLFLTFDLGQRNNNGSVASMYGSSSDISIQSKAHLVAPGTTKTYAFVKAEGIPVSPESRSISAGDRVEFRLYFERLDADVEQFNMFECNNDGNTTCWNITGMAVPKETAHSN